MADGDGASSATRCQPAPSSSCNQPSYHAATKISEDPSTSRPFLSRQRATSKTMIATSKDSAPPQPASSASSPILATSSVHMSGTAEAVSLFDTHTKELIWVLPFFLVHLLDFSSNSLDFHTTAPNGISRCRCQRTDAVPSRRHHCKAHHDDRIQTCRQQHFGNCRQSQCRRVQGVRRRWTWDQVWKVRMHSFPLLLVKVQNFQLLTF